jgi:hypothetical protein
MRLGALALTLCVCAAAATGVSSVSTASHATRAHASVERADTGTDAEWPDFAKAARDAAQAVRDAARDAANRAKAAADAMNRRMDEVKAAAAAKVKAAADEIKEKAQAAAAASKAAADAIKEKGKDILAAAKKLSANVVAKITRDRGSSSSGSGSGSGSSSGEWEMPARCATCEEGGGAEGRPLDAAGNCDSWCSSLNFCGVSQAYRANGTRCYPLSPICKACAENGFRTIAEVEVMGEEDCKNTVIVELAKAKRAAEGVLQRRALDGADRLIPMIIGNGVCRSALDTNLRTRAQVARMPEDDCRNTVIGAIAKHMTEKDGAKAASVVPALQAKSSDELAGQWENIWWQEQQVVVEELNASNTSNASNASNASNVSNVTANVTNSTPTSREVRYGWEVCRLRGGAAGMGGRS